jgi:hypothetical protein
MVGQIRPDIVLTSNVERYLDNVQQDAVRPAFQMMAFLGDREQPRMPADFPAAFSAILSYPRQPYRQFWLQFA